MIYGLFTRAKTNVVHQQKKSCFMYFVYFLFFSKYTLMIWKLWCVMNDLLMIWKKHRTCYVQSATFASKAIKIHLNISIKNGLFLTLKFTSIILKLYHQKKKCCNLELKLLRVLRCTNLFVNTCKKTHLQHICILHKSHLNMWKWIMLRSQLPVAE